MEINEYLDTLRQDIAFSTRLGERKFDFHTTWGIFSPREIDAGTALMLPYMEIAETDDCLDIGCGYGPVGMYMASLAPKGKTLMLDKDFVAVNYSNRNLKANGLENGQAILSNGLADIEPGRSFDVIASNIPAKVGKELMLLMLYDALEKMNPEGRIYVVTINGLRQFMKKNLQQVFGNYKKLKQGSHYTVAVASKTEQ